MIKCNLTTCTIVTLIAGCSASNQQQSTEKYEGRTETKPIEGASAVGYDGTAMRMSVDNALNKNDSSNQELDKAQKASDDGQQK
jgi:uncharacterized protein YdeI (BOF family)